ncbi:MAG TPA: pitrilysin family protein [Thermoanaerobaculia bacterium]
MKALSKALLASILVFGLAGSAGSLAAQSTAQKPAAKPKTTAAPAKTSTSSPKPSPSAAPVRVTSVEGITEYKLANGLTVLLFPDPTKATITVNVTYKVGSRNENYGETGMAHLLEHMLFKGTPNHRNIPQELTAHGARPNGSTWFDRTNYFETFQATDENLKWALDLEADRMVNSYVAKKDLDTEMTVVRNEFELGENDPAGILQERVLSTAFLWHNYGKSTIGAKSDLENVPIERLQAFYRAFYQPDNAVLLVAGRFDEPKTLALVNQTFGRIPKPTRPIPTFYTLDPTQDGERTVTLQRVGDVQAIAAAYHVPSGTDPSAGAVNLLAQILTDTPSGRLYKALVETKKATSVGGYFMELHDPGFLMFNAEVRQDQNVQDAKTALVKTLDDAGGAAPITKEEVDRARATILKNVDLMLNNADRVGLNLSEYIGQGDWRLFFLTRDRVRSATLEDVQKAAAAYLKPSNRTLGVFLPTPKPDRSEVPPPVLAADAVKGYKGDAAIAAGEAFDASPANVESRTKRSTLGNGAQVALLTKKTRGGTVVATMTLRFGDEKSLMGKSTAADLAADMLMRGTTKHTRQQIKDELDRLKARMTVGGGPTQASLSVETIRENLPAVLKLAAEILREPAFPAKEFDELQQENLATIEQQRSEPDALAPNLFERHMNPYPKGDVRYTETFDESLADYKAATLEDAKKFYGGYFGASNAQLAVVGDFDEPEIGKLIGELFGDWKSPVPFARVPSVYQDVQPLNQGLETPDKANAFFIAGQNLALRDDDPDYAALVLGNYMLGGGFLNSRLAVRIRQKDGLSYGVGSQLAASPLDKSGAFTTFAIYAPQNEAKLESAFLEEVGRVLKDGYEAKEIAEAKSGWLQSRQVTRAQDSALARTLTTDLYLKRTLAWDADFEKKVAALTAEQIVSAMRKYLDPTKMTIVKAGDFANAAKGKGASTP